MKEFPKMAQLFGKCTGFSQADGSICKSLLCFFTLERATRGVLGTYKVVSTNKPSPLCPLLPSHFLSQVPLASPLCNCNISINLISAN